MSMGNRVSFRYSTFVKVSTVLVLLTMATAFGMMFANGEILQSENLVGTIILWTVLPLSFLTLGYFVAIAPRYYILDDKGLYIKFLIGGKFFSREVYAIETGLPMSEIKGAIRLFGSGGFFGYLGLFRVPSKGTCHFYLTNREGSLICLREKSSGKYTYVSQ